MRKSQEIDILREAAAKLGDDSYCGPFLTMLIPQIEQTILSDLAVEFDIRRANADCVDVRERARKEAEDIMASAQSKASAILAAAKEQAEELRKSAVAKLQDAVKVIEGSGWGTSVHGRGAY